MTFRTRHFAGRYGLTAVAAAVMGLAAGAAQAQTSDRVEITGSIIKRVSDDTALPISNITAGEIEARGHVELKEFLLELPESHTIGSYAGTVGTLVNLRGLGQARSLTLMNGRRFANEPLTMQYVSANGIPKIALSRVETLRDGASSSYGSDAIGGVQNFLTLKSFSGFKIKGDMMEPQRDGGGGTKGLGLLAGFGDLSRQGFNFYGAVEHSTRDVLFRRDRPELSGLDANGLPNNALSEDMVAMGLAASTDLNANQSSPANFLVARNATTQLPTGTVYNPYAPAGCTPPTSVRTSTTGAGLNTCSTNLRYLDTGTFGNETELTNIYARGTLALGSNHQLSLEANHSVNYILQFSNVVGINNANYYLSLPKTSKWYPGGTGGVPAVVSGTTTIANANVAASPSTLFLRWLPLDAGLPLLRDEHINDRVVLAAEGAVMGWDYRAGLNYGTAQRNTMMSRIYKTADLQAGLNNGTLNPFGIQDATGMAYLQSTQINDAVRRKNQTWNKSLDFTVSRELFNLSGGPALLGIGGEVRRERWQAIGFELNAMTTVAGAVQGQNTTGSNAGRVPTIHMNAIPNSNQPDTSMNGDAKRETASLFTELEMPVTKALSLNAAVRADRYKYSHQTIDSVNPKISARYSPSPLFMVRASANSGFRAPALPEVFGNAEEQKDVTSFSDPLYCNTANNTSTNPALTAAEVCNFTLTSITKSRSAGTTLKPEKSKAYTFGFGLQPSREVNITADYWHTDVDDVLGVLDEFTMAKFYSQYAAQFIRDPGTGRIQRVLNSKANVGKIEAAGVDVSFKADFKLAGFGTVSPGIDISYLTKFRSQPVGTDWVNALGMSEPGGITTQDGLTGNRAQINRWKHTASISWKNGPWAATVAQRYQSGLIDRNEPARVNAAGSAGARMVEPYEQINLTASYSGIKNMRITLGVNNLNDVKPPLTNNSRYQGYLTQQADVLGRAYQVSAEYKY